MGAPGDPATHKQRMAARKAAVMYNSGAAFLCHCAECQVARAKSHPRTPAERWAKLKANQDARRDWLREENIDYTWEE